MRNVSKQYVLGGGQSMDLKSSLRNKLHRLKNGIKSERFFALHDIDLDVKEGDAVGIIGRNGSGKSTMLKVLSRITEPTTGRIELYGRISSLLEVGTGFHPELSGKDNVYLNGTILGMKRKEVARKYDQIVEFSGIEKFIHTPIKHYSSGMKVRLAFAVAAHLDPEILMIDEVLAVGDAEFQKKCLGKMGEVASEGRTVLFVSHDMEAVTDLCNKGVLLEKGEIAFKGSATEVVNAYMASFKRNTEVLEREFDKIPGPARITKASFLTSNLSPNYKYDEHIRLRVEYDLYEDVPEAEINFDLYKGKERLGMFFGRDIKPDANKVGKNSVELLLPIGLLNKGNYHINLMLHDNYRRFFDIRYEALSFNILNKHPRYANHILPDHGILNIQQPDLADNLD